MNASAGGAKIRTSCNDDYSMDENEENKDLEKKLKANQLKTKETAAFARKDTLLDEIKQTEEAKNKVLNQQPGP